MSAKLLSLDSRNQDMIIRGKDKSETGVIKRVIRSQNRFIVKGKNLMRDGKLTHYSIAFDEVSLFTIPLLISKSSLIDTIGSVMVYIRSHDVVGLQCFSTSAL
ncbi:uncharacterized protein LOC130714431 [Lotus japonicus]|uniref:uncharacterized protein LOC130714431 n=1 Tax=Lotus japonicus TaxID=34305 RepID=UPI00258F4A49|nr:uncharacterized protein LOC130714431 [Lotus japonicus]